MENNIKKQPEESGKKEIFDIDIPVVYVTGIVSEINCLRESIELQRSFQKQGYIPQMFPHGTAQPSKGPVPQCEGKYWHGRWPPHLPQRSLFHPLPL